jgi:hypothetical protein
MKTLPEGWELECMKTALAHAGFAYAERQGFRGTPMLSFNYGPSPAEHLWITVQAGPGVMCFTGYGILPSKAPSLEELLRANDVCIDWPFGKLYWEPEQFCAAATLFAYPDWSPLGSDVRIVCHELWEARGNLSHLQPHPMPDEPAGPPLAELVQILSRRTGVPWREKDGRYLTRLDAGDGTCGLTLSQTGPGTYLFDVLPLGAAPWPGDLDGMRRLHGVSARLMRGAATWWNKGQVVVRDPWLVAMMPIDHPEWAGLMLDHAITAAELVTRESRR